MLSDYFLYASFQQKDQNTSTPYVHPRPDNYDVSYGSSDWGTRDKVFLICEHQNVPENSKI